MKSNKNKMVKRTLTLSKYYFGEHSFDPKAKGDYSFAESLNPISFMIEEIAENVPLGSKIEVIMKVVNNKR